MSGNISVWLLATVLLTTAPPAEAQSQAKIPRIGYVSGTGDSSNPGPYVEALRQGLRDLGYVEGKNFVIEYRGAEGKRPDAKPRHRARRTQGRCPRRPDCSIDPRCQAGHQDDPHYHGDSSGSSGDWASR
jgi:hypothetical protein